MPAEQSSSVAGDDLTRLTGGDATSGSIGATPAAPRTQSPFAGFIGVGFIGVEVTVQRCFDR
jgi:hypothetical protein